MLTILCVLESGTWAEPHIAESLRALGHHVHVFHYGQGVGEFYGGARGQELAKKNRALVEIAKALYQSSGLDLIFCYVYDDFLQEETARALARLGVPMVNYNVDMVNQWYRQTITARYFTRMLCAQRNNMEQLARYNPRVLYFPMAGRSVLSGTRSEDTFTPPAPVTFLGTPMTHRVRVLSRLHEHKVPLAIYGKYWQEGRQACAPASLEKIVHDMWNYAAPKLRAEGVMGLLETVRRRFRPVQSSLAIALPSALFKGFVPDESLHSLFLRSAINLGFTRISGDDPDTPGVTQIKLRDFEVPLAGGFYLVEWVSEYERFFTPGVEIETWKTPAELLAKIRFYLVHEKERKQIAAAGKLKAESGHTWDKRFCALFSDLGLRP